MSTVLAIARRQRGLVTWWQLLELGLSPKAILHRVRTGRLHRVRRGVYAVGRPDLDRLDALAAGVLACGPDAVASHRSAAGVWEIRPLPHGLVEISVPACVRARPPGVRVHRRKGLGREHLMHHRGVPLTSPTQTLLDVATRLGRDFPRGRDQRGRQA